MRSVRIKYRLPICKISLEISLKIIHRLIGIRLGNYNLLLSNTKYKSLHWNNNSEISLKTTHKLTEVKLDSINPLYSNINTKFPPSSNKFVPNQKTTPKPTAAKSANYK